MILIGKQFKTLNRKLNSLLQIQAGGGATHSISSLEVDLMLKRQEGHLHDVIQDIDRNNKKVLKSVVHVCFRSQRLEACCKGSSYLVYSRCQEG